jgi:hypothetical protein
VNVAAVDVREMKALARASGLTFRHFCERALRDAARQLRENLRLSYWQASILKPKQIRRLAQRTALMHTLSILAPEKN